MVKSLLCQGFKKCSESQGRFIIYSPAGTTHREIQFTVQILLNQLDVAFFRQIIAYLKERNSLNYLNKEGGGRGIKGAMDLDQWITTVKEGQHLAEDELQLLCEYVMFY